MSKKPFISHEPSFQDLVTDPVIQSLMTADGVTELAIRTIGANARQAISDRKAQSKPKQSSDDNTPQPACAAKRDRGL